MVLGKSSLLDAVRTGDKHAFLWIFFSHTREKSLKDA